MKKLIDETDFDNIQQLSRKWKKQPQPKPTESQIRQNEFHSETTINFGSSDVNTNRQVDPEQDSDYVEKTESHYDSKNGFGTKKRNPVPQVIYEDTEEFKKRLERWLNGFKTDAVSQFMGMKRSMLDYQKECVKSDTQKYLTMYEEKHQELLETREKLIEMTRVAERKTIQVEQMADFISKLNERIKITRHLSRPFALLYENKMTQKMDRFKMTEAAKHDKRRLKYKALKGWMNDYKFNKE